MNYKQREPIVKNVDSLTLINWKIDYDLDALNDTT